ncbi:MAG: CYTH domain-containing protein [Bacteroidales bacterium]|nr:CYTH domain-containing protein [Bacteroidales bacterium]
MSLEIERKYLVVNSDWKTGLTEADSAFIQQAYLSIDPERVVRVRIRDNAAFITIKSLTIGITRKEFEYSIPVADAIEILELSKSSVLVKRRYTINYKGDNWEVDEFLGRNKGLVLAEIELENENQKFELPPWLGEEVSHDPKYSNLQLALDG